MNAQMQWTSCNFVKFLYRVNAIYINASSDTKIYSIVTIVNPRLFLNVNELDLESIHSSCMVTSDFTTYYYRQ